MTTTATLRRLLACATSLAVMSPGSTVAQAQTEAGSAALFSGPTVAELRRDGIVELSLSGAAGATPSPTDLQLFANVGSLNFAEPERGPVLRYTLPAARFPQVALLAAYDRGRDAVAIHRILLLGTPRVDIKSEPNVEVQVLVGEQRFGPAMTDDEGLVQLEIKVPPGTVAVQTLATDSYGNVREGSLDIPLPPFSRLLPICVSDPPAVWIASVDAAGDFTMAPDFALESSELQLEPVETVGPGLFRVPLRPATEPEVANDLEVTVKRDDESVRCSVHVEPLPPRPPPTLVAKVVPIDPERRFGVGLRAGYSTNFGKVRGPLTAFRGSYSFFGSRGGPFIALEAAYGYSSLNLTTVDDEPLTLTVQRVPLVAFAGYGFQWGPWVVGGSAALGASWLQAAAKSVDTQTYRRWVPAFGGYLHVSRYWNRNEVRVDLGGSRQKLPSGAITGNAAGAELSAGYVYHF